MAVGHADEKGFLTPKNVLSRWFALLSGTLATLAGDCIANLVAGPDASLNVAGAVKYTFSMLASFSLLAGFFYQHKKALQAASKDETKKGLMGMTPSEELDMAVDEGITNLTSAMASVLAGLWFGLLPKYGGVTMTLEILLGGCLVLAIGEFIQLSLTKDSKSEYIVKLLNGMNCGSVSWWVGNATANLAQNHMGCDDGESACVGYPIFFITLLSAALNLELIQFLSTKVPSQGAGTPYFKFIFTMLKGYPMYTAGLILNNIVMFRNTNDYLTSTMIWLGLSAVIVVAFDQFVHNPNYKSLANAYAPDPKAVITMVNEVVTLVGQILAFVVGSLASGALGADFTSGSFGFWVGFACFWQVLSFVVQGARTTCLPAMFKDVASARESAEYIKLDA